ncbi:hypothetical protein [Gloeocapsa sp. PCC 73106]|uniref:hypothetical protein n=1 Tax=Gloeocapsa sp. PCC 73106 TaxID=102232 RepID=UPI0002ABB55E|nr:hypothetical protein [Gloeocapsa sp. PCC 73106]ELR97809.1 hypothetical protein GLO73106DRAFT_00016260 [Gloeocapsa sp. PCC 73106]
MLGKFQTSNLRVEVEASGQLIRDYLIHPRKLREWFWLGNLSSGLPEIFSQGLNFTTTVGLVKIGHQVDVVEDYRLRFLLNQGIDGYQEWLWGDGWLQSRLEGISLLPLNLSQTATLWGFKQFLGTRSDSEKRSPI